MPCAQVFGYAQENKTYKRPSVNTIYKTYNRYNTNKDDDTTIIIKYLHIVIILTPRRCYRENLCHGNIYLNIVVSTGRGCEHIVIFPRRFAYWYNQTGPRKMLIRFIVVAIIILSDLSRLCNDFIIICLHVSINNNQCVYYCMIDDCYCNTGTIDGCWLDDGGGTVKMTLVESVHS